MRQLALQIAGLLSSPPSRKPETISIQMQLMSREGIRLSLCNDAQEQPERATPASSRKTLRGMPASDRTQSKFTESMPIKVNYARHARPLRTTVR